MHIITVSRMDMLVYDLASRTLELFEFLGLL